MRAVKFQSKVALFYLLIAAILGVLLRLFPFSDFNANFRFIVHTHSHIALLGWAYIALTTILYKIGIPNEKKEAYNVLFWSSQTTIIGMLFSFPFVGYALYSILFSTLFILCTYWFYYFFRKHNNLDKKALSYKFITTSLLFLIVSSLGLWLLGVIMNTVGNGSHWYKNAIYFYLHFQYNGWFLFCLIGLLFYIVEKQEINFPITIARRFYQLFTISCILTLFLCFLWIKPKLLIFIVAGFGAVLQCISFLLFYKSIKKTAHTLKKWFGHFNFKVLQFILGMFFIKILLQLFSALPYFAEITYAYIDFVIGYLHLVFLGIITPTILIFLKYLQILLVPKIWIKLYLIGFVVSEMLLFYKGITIWQQKEYLENYAVYLLFISSLLPISILGVFLKNLKKLPFSEGSYQ